MRQSGKIDYLELPAAGGTLDLVKNFYASALGWQFTDYGPSYAAFKEGLEGGFQGDALEAPAKPLPVLYAEDLEAALASVKEAGGRIIRGIFAFPGGRRFHFADPAGNELAVWSER